MSPRPAPISSASDLAMPSLATLGDSVLSTNCAFAIVVRNASPTAPAHRPWFIACFGNRWFIFIRSPFSKLLLICLITPTGNAQTDGELAGSPFDFTAVFGRSGQADLPTGDQCEIPARRGQFIFSKRKSGFPK